nr:unnamed protein product [Callosobruchus analis]
MVVLNELVPLIDVLGCKCKLDNINYHIYVLYIPPKVTQSELEIFLDNFEQLLVNEENVSVLGDFNIPNYVNNNNSDPKTFTFNSFLDFVGLQQHNSVLNSFNRLLDLVLSNQLVDVTRDDIPMINEDEYHPAINARIFVKKDKANSATSSDNLINTYNFRKADFVQLYYQLINSDWTFLDSLMDVDTMVEAFFNRLYYTLDQCVPRHRNNKRIYPCWFTSQIIYYIQLKEHYRALYKRSGEERYYSHFSRIRRTVKAEIGLAYRNYIRAVENSVSYNPQSFWAFVQRNRGNSRIPNSVLRGDEQVEGGQAIIEGFAQFFSSVFEPRSAHTAFTATNSNTCITVECFTEDQVFNILKKLANKMTAGDDAIPSFLVRDCARVFAVPLVKIYSAIIQQHRFPKIWKVSKICPVFKNGEPTRIENYRGISILCNFSKGFEMLLYNQIFPQIKPLIADSQHGFISKRSTLSNLTVIK